MNYFNAAEATNLFRVSALDKSKQPFMKFTLMAILGGAYG